MKIGFIGLGIMGKPMAKNLISGGYKLIVHDINMDATRELIKLGSEPADSPKEVAGKAEIIITMLPDSPEVEQVFLGLNGLVEGLKSGKICVDMSSIEPLVAIEISKELEKIGAGFLDAPVSGGEPKAIDGTLAIMVGGPEDIYKKCLPVFAKMGKNIIRVGKTGSGQIAKLANQIIVAINIAAMSEALIMAKKAGVNPENIFNAIRGGLAGSAVLEAKAPLVMNRDFKPGFKVELHIKDLMNVFKTSHHLNVPLPLTGIVMEIMQALKVENLGEADHSAIALFYEKIANTRITNE
ncbi:MAG: 2-hydroxy-3-oxopropionate reductase [Actinobacteria bacterium]|nr:2-hydroxy-3-oxopropionate reductase [Actinomycetota bacterium]